MITALTIIITLGVSIFVVRVGSVALSLTGLSFGVARFQALSAFSGTGFSTTESEQIVNYPVRRRIIMWLMVVGNLGLVAVMSTVVVGFVTIEKDAISFLVQFAWLLIGLAFLWFLTMSKTAEKILNRVLRRFLIRYTELGKLPFKRLLQIGETWSVGEHQITVGALHAKLTVADIEERLEGGEIMAIRDHNGETVCKLKCDYEVEAGDLLIVFAQDQVHQSLFPENVVRNTMDGY